MPYFDRFDVCAAYGVYASDYGGDAYANSVGCRLSRLRFKPSCSEETLDGLTDNAKEIYGRIVVRQNGDYVAYERLHRRAPHVFPAWPGNRNVGEPRAFVKRLGVDASVLDSWRAA